MHSHLTLAKAPYASRWSTRSSVEKALFAGALLAISISSQRIAVMLLVLATASVAALVFARVGFRNWLAWLATPILLAAVTALVTAWSAPGEALMVLARAVSAASCVALLSLTTPMPVLLELFRRCGLPAAIADLIWLMSRSVFLLMEQISATRRAVRWRLRPAGWREELNALAGVAAAAHRRALVSLTSREAAAQWRLAGSSPRVLSAEQRVSVGRLCGYSTLLLAFAFWSLR